MVIITSEVVPVQVTTVAVFLVWGATIFMWSYADPGHPSHIT